jgi:hypothetical protein
MATIIDSLLMTLGIDSSEFDAGKAKVDKGLKETGTKAEETGKKLNQSGKTGAQGFEDVAKSAAKFLALLGGTVVVKRFIEQTIESSAALDRLSKNLNESVSSISAYSNAVEILGGTAAGLQGTMDMLSQSQTELQLTGQSNLIPYFSALSISLADTQGKARPVSDLLLDLADRFSKLDRPTANNMGRMMGIDQGTMNLLLKGRSEVELMIARQKQYGAVTKQQAEEATRMQMAMVGTRQSFEAFGRELLTAATPALETLIDVFYSLSTWMRENKEFVQTFLSIIAVGLGAIAAAMIPINLTVVAILGLAAAISALWQDYQTWKRGGESFIDWSKWEPGFKAAGEGIRWLKDLMGDLMYRAIAAADVLASLFKRDWKGAQRAAKEFITGNGKEYGAAPQGPQIDVGKEQEAAMSYFQAQGWTKEQSAGLVANIKQESGFKANAVGDNGKAYGIAQWHPDRQAEFEKIFGKSIKGSSMADQLAFMQYELTQGKEKRAGDILRGTSGAAESAAVVSTHYERPKDTAKEASVRGQLALQMLGGVPGASGAAAGAGAANVAQANSPTTIGGNRSVETHIGEVKVYSAATDANGIAKDMGKSLDYLFASQANYGLN